MTLLKSAIQKIAWSGTTDPTKAKVVAIDKANNTVDVFIEELNAVLPDVMLLCLIDNPEEKFIVYPKVSTDETDSIVTIDFLNDTLETAIVTKVHHVDEIIMRGDAFGGLVKIIELVDRLNKIEKAYNDLANKWNSYCSVYAPGSPSTVGLPSTLATSNVDTISETNINDIENPKIKHG